MAKHYLKAQTQTVRLQVNIHILICWIYKQHSKLNIVDKHIFLNELKETLSE